LKDYSITELDSSDISVVNCPSQENGYDCGMYAITFAEWCGVIIKLGKSILEDDAQETIFKEITAKRIRKKRD